MTTDTYTTAGTFTWTAPVGVTSVDVECIGGGGGGRGGIALSRGGGGGRGGDYAFKTITVVPGTGYTVVVGAAGGGSAYNSNTGLTSGGISTFNSTSVAAAGGSAAANGFGGTTANGTSIGTTINTGTSGGTSTNSSGSDGGAGGAGGTPLGGAGGVAGNTGTPAGGNATAPGGGGGGGRGNTAGASGGNGADGQVSITYTPAGVYTGSSAQTANVGVISGGLVGKLATAAVAVGVAISAAGVVGTSSPASQTAAVGITATGTAAAAGFTGTTSRSVAVGVTPAGVVGKSATAAVTPAVAITAAGTVTAITTTTYSTAGSFTWTAPAGVTSVDVQLEGGGGGGSFGSGGGAGGKGGSYAAKTVSVTPGNGYTVVVGAAGVADTTGSGGGAGGISSFNSTSVVAAGGGGGDDSGNPTTANNGTSVGTTTADGTAGAAQGGGHGGDGGAGAAPLGGAGGVHTAGAGNPGVAPGGGGAAGTGATSGGAGAVGRAVLTYTTSSPGGTATISPAVAITATGTVASSLTTTRPVAVGITATGSVAGSYNATGTRVSTVTITAAGTVTASASAGADLINTITITAAGTVTAAPLPTIGRPTLRPPGKLLVRATAPGSTRPTYLNRSGIVTNLSYRWGLPGGPLDATMSLDATATANVPDLTVGSTIEICRGGGVVWTGRVNTLTKGTPWQINCSGLGGIANTETALTQGNIDDIVDASIADGLPWTRPATLGSYQWFESSSDGPITTKLDEVLSSTLTLYGKRWTVDNDGVLTEVDEPDGLPTLLVKVNDPSIPVGLANYATRVSVRYNDGTTGFPVETVINAAAEAQYGRVAVAIYAQRGQAHTAPEAAAFGQAFLDRNSPRLTVTGGFTITNRQITTVTGGVVDLPDVATIVGQVARLQFAVPLYDAQVGATSTIDMVVGAATYDDDNATLTLEPIDGQDTPVQIMLAGATHELAR